MTPEITRKIVDTADEYAFSDKDFRMISDLANRRYGLALQSSKKALVYSRLAKRLRALGLSGFSAYCTLLNHDGNTEEHRHFLSALTTNVTHFFREKHHFDFLRDQIAPLLLKKAESGQTIRIWSSACSAGQEAYSIAATFVAASSNFLQADMKILATDIDPKMIEKAKRGLYPADQLSAIPQEWRKHILASSNTEQDIEIRQELRGMITFGELNLVDTWPMRRRFDVIFCRNAAIYFDKQTQARLWQRFSETLVENGHLMIGHSERISGPATTEFRSVGITTYLKIPHAETSHGSHRKV